MRYLTLLILVALVIACKPKGNDATNNVSSSDPNKPIAATSLEHKKQLAAEAEKSLSNDNVRYSENHDGHNHESHDHNHDDHNHEGHNHEGHDHGNSNVNLKGNLEDIPDPCKLLSTKTIARQLNISADALTITEGTSSKSTHARSCFFKWDDEALPNAGVLVQVQTNPVADDVPEYPTFLIESKRSQGEKAFNSETVYKYERFNGYGDDGSYSKELGKYMWRVDNDWVFMVAFNTPQSKDREFEIAKVLANEVMSKMTF